MKKTINTILLSLIITNITTNTSANNDEFYNEQLSTNVTNLIREIWTNPDSISKSTNSTNYIHKSQNLTAEYHDFGNNGIGTGDFLTIAFSYNSPIKMMYFIDKNNRVSASLNSTQFPQEFRAIKTDGFDLDLMEMLTEELQNKYVNPQSSKTSTSNPKDTSPLLY